MPKQTPDMISEKDFTMLNVPKGKRVYPAPKDLLPRDENSDPNEETLLGMEYDVESIDEDEKSDDESS
jgi:hypothetical protein